MEQDLPKLSVPAPEDGQSDEEDQDYTDESSSEGQPEVADAPKKRKKKKVLRRPAIPSPLI